MGKYDALRDHLHRCADTLVMTFDKVADLVGGLPASAYSYVAWWSNDDPTHSHSKSWAEAGYTAAPDLTGLRVRFTRREHIQEDGTTRRTV